MVMRGTPRRSHGGLKLRVGGRLATIAAVLRHFASSQRFVLIPLVLVLLLAGLLLLLTGGLAYVAPFVYTLF